MMATMPMTAYIRALLSPPEEGVSTVTAQVAASPPSSVVAVMVAVPAFIAFTTPS